MPSEALLLAKDHCDDFDGSNEPTLNEVNDALMLAIKLDVKREVEAPLSQ